MPAAQSVLQYGRRKRGSDAAFDFSCRVVSGRRLRSPGFSKDESSGARSSVAERGGFIA